MGLLLPGTPPAPLGIVTWQAPKWGVRRGKATSLREKRGLPSPAAGKTLSPAAQPCPLARGSAARQSLSVVHTHTRPDTSWLIWKRVKLFKGEREKKRGEKKSLMLRHVVMVTQIIKVTRLGTWHLAFGCWALCRLCRLISRCWGEGGQDGTHRQDGTHGQDCTCGQQG